MKHNKYTTYAYIRVSSKDQNEHRQLLEMRKLGIKDSHIYMDKLSGKDFNRPSYKKLVYEVLKKDDLLVVKSIDRLGRNYHEILDEWKVITKQIGANIRILDMPLLDTTQCRDLLGTLISDIVLQLLSFVAENERNNIHQRQAEGIAAAKLRGIRFGRPKTPVPRNFESVYKKWKNKELPIEEALKRLKLPRHTFYRMAKRYEEGTLYED